MVFKSTEWEFSNMSTEQQTAYVQPETGDQYLVIADALYNADSQQYQIFFESLLNSAKFRITYFMKTKEGKDNWYTARTLKSLGRALNNEDKVLAPNDIIGTCVRANVLLEPARNDPTRSYAKIEEYFPIPEEMLAFSEKPEQYCLPAE